MRHLQNFFIGTGGTFATIALSPEKWAAIFSGLSVGIWMLTQTYFLIRDKTRK